MTHYIDYPIFNGKAPVFAVRAQDGHIFEIYADGTLRGFPEGSLFIFNRLPLYDDEIILRYLMNRVSEYNGRTESTDGLAQGVAENSLTSDAARSAPDGER